MLVRQVVLLGQVLMDRRGHVGVGKRRRGQFHIRNQARRVGVATFGEMDFVADPNRAALAAVARLGVVG
jgi:hypothetical protein